MNESNAKPPKFLDPYFARFASYVDETGHSKDPKRMYFCLAGLVATQEVWKSFDTEWRQVAAEESINLPFHMKDFAHSHRQFAGWSEERRQRLLGKLMTTIRRAAAIPVGSVVSVKAFNALEPKFRSGLRDPYFVAFQHLTWHMVVAASLNIPGGPVSMVYAHHPEHSRGRGNSEQLWDVYRRGNPILAPFMENYVGGQPKDHTPLQAADIWAYELGHHFERIRPSGKNPRWAYRQFVEMGVKAIYGHDFLTVNDAAGVHGVGAYSQATRGTQWNGRVVESLEPDSSPGS
ncbi:MAG TPA: DUF3800 domain-containing protein [Candidatus Acidoferrum sp.]|nr:DUF3800 domain-containing protein [Candidatus Acidoferrum sp.]